MRASHNGLVRTLLALNEKQTKSFEAHVPFTDKSRLKCRQNTINFMKSRHYPNGLAIKMPKSPGANGMPTLRSIAGNEFVAGTVNGDEVLRIVRRVFDLLT
jgi:hypothetical protein